MTSPKVLPTALLTAALISLAALSSAQTVRIENDPYGDAAFAERNCATAVPTEEEQAAVASTMKAYLQQNGIEATGGQIKVAWHVIYSGSTGNIPQSQINSQIAVLNADFAGTGYTFVLASTDRTNNNSWWTMTPNTNKERNAKNALKINVPGRLNVYTCKPGQGLLGWATFPWSYSQGDYRHGVVIHYGSVPGGYLTPYNQGRTLTHEIGHYLGLYHTFQGGCTGQGDYVSDTPAEASPAFGCPSGRNTCSSAGNDPITNYMDYTDDACMTNFTTGQDARIDAAVTTYRPSLLNAAVAQAEHQPAGEDLSSRPFVIPAVLSLSAGPNPFSIETNLFFALPRAGHVTLKIYNVAGQLVETLVDGDMPAGEHRTLFRARTLPAGMYFTRLQLDGEIRHKSVILVQ